MADEKKEKKPEPPQNPFMKRMALKDFKPNQELLDHSIGDALKADLTKQEQK